MCFVLYKMKIKIGDLLWMKVVKIKQSEEQVREFLMRVVAFVDEYTKLIRMYSRKKKKGKSKGLNKG